MWEKTESKKPKGERKPLPTKPVVDNRAVGGGKMKQSQQDAYNEEASKNYNDNVLEKCGNCGRTFLPDRLVVHLKSCKGPVASRGSMSRKSGVQGSVGSPSIKGNTVSCKNCGKSYA